MGNGSKHNGGVKLMSGEFHYHMNLINRIYPLGLHRELYVITNTDKEPFSDVKLIKHRVSTKVLQLENEQFMIWILKAN